MPSPVIAIVDDDTAHLAVLQRALDSRAHVRQFESAELFLKSEALPLAHLIILDWNLPGMNGLEALRVLRSRYNTPVLFLTSFDAESKVVAALSSGADDYLVKPFRTAELLARIHVLLRRFHAADAIKVDANKLLPSGVILDAVALTVAINGAEPVKLSYKEYALAVLLFQNVGIALARETILRTVWEGDSEVTSRTLDTHISRLRTRLSLRPELGWRLSPVYSFGYRLDIDDIPPEAQTPT